MKRTYVLTDFWSGNHRPYRNILRNLDDSDADSDAMNAAIAASGAVDGDEIEIIVRKTGRRPFGDRRVRLVAPHTYRREPEPAKENA